jgi:hypothetical protein
VHGKVIYVSVMRLSDKAARDWYVDYLIEKGMAVEYWDVASLVFGDDEHRSKAAPFLRTPGTYSELESLLRTPENASARYVMLVPYDRKTTRLYRLFSRYECRMVVISWGAQPIGHGQRWRRRLANAPASIRNVAGNMKAALYRKLGIVKRFEIVFAAGEALLSGTHHATRVVPINLVDFDHYARARSQTERLVEGRYAVFLDIYLPHQSDLRIVGLRPIDAEDYYRSLNRFFGLVETQLGVRVAIAAHPKASYDATTFEGRPTIVGRTPELVRDADLVISHHSTSLSYAVLNRKPIIFIYTDGMKEEYDLTVVSYLRDLAAYLDATVCNIDELDASARVTVKPVSESRYDEYKYSFLTSRASEHERTADIFWRELSGAVGA